MGADAATVPADDGADAAGQGLQARPGLPRLRQGCPSRLPRAGSASDHRHSPHTPRHRRPGCPGRPVPAQRRPLRPCRGAGRRRHAPDLARVRAHGCGRGARAARPGYPRRRRGRHAPGQPPRARRGRHRGPAAARHPDVVLQHPAAERLAYVAGDSDTRVVICDAEHLDTWLELRDELDGLEHLVVHDLHRRARRRAALGRPRRARPGAAGGHAARGVPRRRGGHAGRGARRAQPPDDPVTIIYTSGTTGPPKGVVLVNRGLRFNAEASVELLVQGMLREGVPDAAGAEVVDGQVHLPPGEPGLSYLPLAHVAERHISHYSSYAMGTEVTYVRDLQDLPEILPQVRPFVFPAVPRVWEKFHAAIMGRIEEADDPRRRKLGLKAMEVAEIKGQADRRASSSRPEDRGAALPVRTPGLRQAPRGHRAGPVHDGLLRCRARSPRSCSTSSPGSGSRSARSTG